MLKFCNYVIRITNDFADLMGERSSLSLAAQASRDFYPSNANSSWTKLWIQSTAAVA